MARKKVVLEYIKSDVTRKATFNKRKKGLVKKVHEITTLCAIDSFAILYSPYDPEPEVYPSVLDAQRVIARFRRLSEVEQSRKMVNQESYTKERISKADEQVKKLQRENHHKHITHVMYACLVGEGPSEMNISDLSALMWILDQNIKEIERRIESLTKNTQPQGMEHVMREEQSLAMDFTTSNPIQYYPFTNNPMQDYQPLNNPMQGYPSANSPMQDYSSMNNPMQGYPPNNSMQNYPWPFALDGTMRPSFYNNNNDEAWPSSSHP